MKAIDESRQAIRGQRANDRQGDAVAANHPASYIMLGETMVAIAEPRIVTRFASPDRLAREDDAKRFVEENMERAFGQATRLLADERAEAFVFTDDDNLGYVEFHPVGEMCETEKLRKMTRLERDAYAASVGKARERFAKRLDSYLSRYGLEYCRFGFYWADR